MNKPTIENKGDKVKTSLYDSLNKMLSNDKELDDRTQRSKNITEAANKKVTGNGTKKRRAFSGSEGKGR